MIVDVSHYKNLFYGLKSLLAIRDTKDILNIVSDFSIGSGCPIIVVSYFALKLTGKNDALLVKIEKLKEFYQYTEIKGLDELEKWD